MFGFCGFAYRLVLRVSCCAACVYGYCLVAAGWLLVLRGLLRCYGLFYWLVLGGVCICGLELRVVLFLVCSWFGSPC